jgi:hypothetical protein
MSWPARRKHEQRLRERRHQAFKSLRQTGDLYSATRAILDARADLLRLARIKRCAGCGGWIYSPEPDPRYNVDQKPCTTCTLLGEGK